MFTYNFNLKLFAFPFLFTSIIGYTQIIYNWQNSKEGWVSVVRVQELFNMSETQAVCEERRL